MRAFCFASGLIAFDQRVPDGALPIARGPAKPLCEFISAKARHGYDVEIVSGRRAKIPGTDCLLVPGVPEANCELARFNALINFRVAINDHAPAGVVVLTERMAAVLL